MAHGGVGVRAWSLIPVVAPRAPQPGTTTPSQSTRHTCDYPQQNGLNHFAEPLRSRDDHTAERLEDLDDPFKVYRCHTIMVNPTAAHYSVCACLRARVRSRLREGAFVFAKRCFPEPPLNPGPSYCDTTAPQPPTARWLVSRL